jgi:hypothetical protein
MKSLYSSIRPLFLLTIIASIVLAACGTSSQPLHVTTIGIVNYTAGLEPVITGLKTNLADAGYVEGKSIAYLYNGPVPNDTTAIDTEIQRLASQLTTARGGGLLQCTWKVRQYGCS